MYEDLMKNECRTPAILLVNPQMGENIGATARAMQNFGLNDLRLVAPRDPWPNPRAYDMAVNAKSLLDSVKIAPTLAEAAADLHRLYATTSRGRDMVKEVLLVADAAPRWVAEMAAGARVGLVFGAERTGLTNDDVARCHAILNIPTDPENASLNLSQAVIIAAYEWFRHGAVAVTPLTSTSSRNASPRNPETLSPPATTAELQGFFDQLEAGLEAGGFFKTEQIKPRMWRNIINLFTRARMTEQEVRTLRGAVRALQNND